MQISPRFWFLITDLRSTQNLLESPPFVSIFKENYQYILFLVIDIQRGIHLKIDNISLNKLQGDIKNSGILQYFSFRGRLHDKKMTSSGGVIPKL